MWSAINVTAIPVWDDLVWHASATWRDDEDSEPVVIVRSGTAPAEGALGARDLLTVVLRAINGAFDDPDVRTRVG